MSTCKSHAVVTCQSANNRAVMGSQSRGHAALPIGRNTARDSWFWFSSYWISLLLLKQPRQWTTFSYINNAARFVLSVTWIFASSDAAISSAVHVLNDIFARSRRALGPWTLSKSSVPSVLTYLIISEFTFVFISTRGRFWMSASGQEYTIWELFDSVLTLV